MFPAARRFGPEVAIAAAALGMNSWALTQNDLGNPYYAAAVRSMTSGFGNFVYASYDPGGWITTDKPPLALWIQATWAKVFGVNSWSLLLPSAIAGALTVWFLILTVRSVWGRSAGIAAGVALALTPTMFAVSRSSNPDAILVCFLMAAVWATQRAVMSERRSAWWMAASGVLVGLAFLAKMLVAVIVLPALVAAYVLGSRIEWRHRLAHLGLLAAGFVVVGAAWVALMDLSASSPYVGGSDDGSAWDLVFGYNGFGRVFGNEGPGGGPVGIRPGGAVGGVNMVGFAPGGNGVDQFGGQPGIGRLFNSGMGDQVMWLGVISLVSLIGAAIWCWHARRASGAAERWSSFALMSVWAICAYLLFAEAEGVFHNYYVSALAPALAGLVGIGVGVLRRSGRIARPVAAGALVLTAVLQVVLVRRIDTFQWVSVVVSVLCALAAAVLVVAALRPSIPAVAHWSLIGGSLLAVCFAPAVWVWGGLNQPQNKSFPDARPANSELQSVGGAGSAPGTGTLSAGMLEYLDSARTGERWIVAVSSSVEANAGIIDGYDVMAMGGFRGGDAAMTVQRLADLVDDGELRFVVAGAGGRGGPGGAGGPGGPPPPGIGMGPPGSGMGPPGAGPRPGGVPPGGSVPDGVAPGGFGTGSAEVTAAVTGACVAVDAQRWGDTGTSTVYDCAGRAEALRSMAPTT